VNRFLFRWLVAGSSFLYAETLNSELKTGESFGVEINPFRFLATAEDDFSGTMSYFDNDNGVEIAIPIFYSDYSSGYGGSETVVDIDLHYRKYFSGNRTEGTYLGAFGRYTHLEGNARHTSQYLTVEKFGLGVEVGYRVKDIFDTPFYWGVSLSFYGYLGNNNNVFEGLGYSPLAFEDNQYGVDVELLKIGYEF
jgi:hypothetical protein